MKARLLFLIATVSSTSAISRARADVVPNPLFSDNAVLQQGAVVPVWGTAEPGEKVTVEIAGHAVSTKASKDGRWLVRLPELKAGGPHVLTISGKNKLVLNNILVGEVWIAGGQSNMERQLGPRGGQKTITNWQQEVADAKYPEIREFAVAQTMALEPVDTVKGSWAVCSPDTVKDFTAVGYFFARDLHRARHVPVGLIHSSWGGTAAEAWMSQGALRRRSDFAEDLAEVKSMLVDPVRARREARERREAWFRASDPGTAASPPWSDTDIDTSAWKTMNLPTVWEDAGYKDFDGTFWFRRTVDLPRAAMGGDGELHLGPIDDVDTTWINGHLVGSSLGWDVPRVYRIPAKWLKPGANVIAVRVLDTGAGGGLWGGDDPMRLVVGAGAKATSLSLAGQWSCRPGVSLADVAKPPEDHNQNPNTATVLWNGMIAPLLPYAIAGVVFYQGESNMDRARQYRSLFPALIEDWRRAWGEGDFPFLFVQVAPYRDMTPEIREAQLWAWQHTTNTAMVVTTDCGDADDIHPAYKQPVGERLSLAARALAYGEKIEYSGPVFASMKVSGAKAVLRFTHADGGLVAKGGPLRGFTVAGADKVFHPARARLRGQTVSVSSAKVRVPVAVRYGWATVPDGNLFNRAGLPASPFRTDED